MISYIDIPDFSGGLNTRDGDGGIADNELSECINCYLIARGIAKRKGFVRYNGSAQINSSNEGTNIIDANFTAGQKIVGTAGTKIAYKGTDAWTDITGSVTLTKDIPVINTMINDNLVGVNGTNPAWYWSGSGNALTLTGDNIPTAPVTCESFVGRLFLAEGRTLYWGDYMADWGDFLPASYQTFNDEITGLKVIGDSKSSFLIVLTERSVHSCHFAPETVASVGGRGVFTFDQISESNGCGAPASVQEVYIPTFGYAIMWADYDGIKFYSPSIGVDKVTDKIRDDWEDLELADIAYFVGVHYRPKQWYMLICREADSTSNDKVIIIDLHNSRVPVHTDIDQRWTIGGYFDWTMSTAGVVKESGVEKLIGSDYSGYWSHYDYGNNDNGQEIDGYFKTKSFDGEHPSLYKGLISAGLHYTNLGIYSVSIQVFLDYLGEYYEAEQETAGVGLGTFVLGTDRLSAGINSLAVTNTELRGWGRTLQLKIRNKERDEPFEIHRLRLNYETGRRVVFT